MKPRSQNPIGQAAPVVLVVALVLALAGCGGRQSSDVAANAERAPASAAPFAWLEPGPTGPAWKVVRLRFGAALAQPPGWRPVRTDSGTASFARLDRNRAIVAYLNATPRQGSESLANWPSFRVHHNAEEGSRDIRTLAAARGLRFRSGPGSCVIDQYRTSARSYREIACLVAAPGRATVVVGAATPALWPQEAPVIERAISAFLA
jgi:hypothetical protein